MLSEARLILTSHNCKLHCLLYRYTEQMPGGSYVVTETYISISRDKTRQKQKPNTAVSNKL